MFYRLKLVDKNQPSFCSFSVSYFTEDIAQFEEDYLSVIPGQRAAELSYKMPDDTFNSLEYDYNSKTIKRKKYSFRKSSFTLVNVYDCETEIFFDKCVIELMVLRFNGEFYLLGQYHLNGVCERDYLKRDNPPQYCKVNIWGNHILKETDMSPKPYYDERIGLNRFDFPRDKFKDNTIDTFAWVVIDRQKNKISLPKRIDNDLIQRLMRDIPGEAG